MSLFCWAEPADFLTVRRWDQIFHLYSGKGYFNRGKILNQVVVAEFGTFIIK